MQNLESREIDRAEAEKTLNAPELIALGSPPRQVLMRRYFDTILNQEMLIRLVVEDSAEERVVITAYKTSQISKYLKGLKS